MLKSNTNDVGNVILLIIGIIILIFGLSLLFAWPVMALWNWLIPSIFGLCKITFWQAWGLNMLSGFLIKSSNVKTNS